MVEMLLAKGCRVEVRLNMRVDHDVVYMGSATRFISGGGGFSKMLGLVASSRKGGTLIDVDDFVGPLPGQCPMPQWRCENNRFGCDKRYGYPA